MHKPTMSMYVCVTIKKACLLVLFKSPSLPPCQGVTRSHT
jgi:hypothetical protein